MAMRFSLDDPKPSEALRRKWREECDYLLENGDTYMSDWERDFVDSISVQLGREKDLTFKQSSTLGRIFHKVQEEVG
jgi:hypothetical protein